MHYIIQENVFREQHYDLLSKALDRLNLKYNTVRVFPFVDKIVEIKDIPPHPQPFDVDDLPEFQYNDKNVFVFGGLKLARLSKDRGWTPGSLMNSNHDFLVYAQHYKDELLNYDSQIHTVGSDLKWKPNEIKFIRPTEDTKAFTGKIFTEVEWKDTIENYLHNYRSAVFNESTKIQVSVPKHISKEIRCWVVDGKIVTASIYKIGSRVVYDDQVEDEAIAYAQSMVNKFQLADAFVIDVCLTNLEFNSAWKIVECGCINAAGFYKSDLQKTIMALEDKFN
jgi:hypothetical protein